MHLANSAIARARTLASFLALSACVAVGCQQIPHRYGRNVVVLPSGGLPDASPSDIVVAPVIIADASNMGDVPEEALRAAFQRFLPLRRYTPLALDYVDERAVEASYTHGACDEEAVIEIVIHRWDDTFWDSRGTIDAVVEARFVDATGTYSQPLWAGRLEQVMNAGGSRESHSSSDRLISAVCDEVARELLEDLPARKVEPGRQ
ncbi:MAG: hypothetical protein ACI841_003389 [Planctomycetota bacterium]|jgi:hypothetical protein